MNLNQISIKPVSNVVEIDAKYANAETRYMVLAHKINTMACFLKYAGEDIKGSASYELKEKLISSLLEIKNLKNFTLAGANSQELLEHQYNAEDYSGLMFYRCFNSAWKLYLKHDPEMDMEQPFLMIFNGLYKKQRPVLTAEACVLAHPDETKYKEYLLKDILRRAIAATGFPKNDIKRINVLNREALKKLLISIGAPNTFLEEIDSVFTDAHVVSHDAHDTEANEMERKTTDSDSLNAYEQADMIIANLISSVERLMDESETWKDAAVHKNLIFYFTLKARQYIESGDTRHVIMLKDFIDEDLLRYANEHESDNDVTILSDYMGEQYNTTRKKLRKVQKALLEMAA